MATKTFKIGESCRGGVITVIVSPIGAIKVIGKELDNSKGHRKSSDQSNAKEFISRAFDKNSSTCMRDLDMFLNYLTTSYYSGKVIEWIKTKVELPNSFFI